MYETILMCCKIQCIPHTIITLHEYNFQQYPDFTAEKATEKGSAKGKSNTSYVLFKLHRFFLDVLYNNIQFSTNNMYNSQSGFICINSFHISLEDHTSITDVCHFSF